MLVVGIILKNVPYNLGQFGRADCEIAANHTEIFVDSLDTPDGRGLFKRSAPVAPPDHHHIVRRGGGGEELAGVNGSSCRPEDPSLHHPLLPDDCLSRFIGHDLDPNISRVLRTVCLTVILLQAGLELDPVALWNLR